MDIDRILRELEENRGYFPREAVEEAIRQRETITPYLLRAIKEATEHAQEWKDEEVPFLPVYAMRMLAQFRDQRAFPLIIDLCRLPRQTLDILIGDTITDGLPRIIASVCDGAAGSVDSIKSVIEDSSIDEYVRGSAIGSLSVLVHEGVLARGDVIDYFADLFRGTLEREYSHVWDVLAADAVDLYATALADDIRGAYEAGLLWPGYMGPKEREKVFAMREETVLARSRERCGGLIDDVVKEMHWWACFQPETGSGTQPADPFRTPANRIDPGVAVRSAPKVGRNAPCPCGSGKKYKKCCGAG